MGTLPILAFCEHSNPTDSFYSDYARVKGRFYTGFLRFCSRFGDVHTSGNAPRRK